MSRARRYAARLLRSAGSDADPAVLELACERFMALRDAARVLEETEQPGWENAAPYLRGAARRVLESAGLPEEVSRALIATYPGAR